MASAMTLLIGRGACIGQFPVVEHHLESRTKVGPGDWQLTIAGAMFDSAGARDRTIRAQIAPYVWAVLPPGVVATLASAGCRDGR